MSIAARRYCVYAVFFKVVVHRFWAAVLGSEQFWDQTKARGCICQPAMNASNKILRDITVPILVANHIICSCHTHGCENRLIHIIGEWLSTDFLDNQLQKVVTTP